MTGPRALRVRIAALLTTLLLDHPRHAVSGVLSVLAAGIFLALPARQREGALPHLVSFATGALLGAALLALIPHAVIGAGIENVHEVGIALIAGIALFFVLEKFLLWRHCHDDHCDEHPVGDAHAHGHATATHHDQRARRRVARWCWSATPCTTCSTAC